MASAYRQAKVLLSAVELRVFSVLANGPLDAKELASHVQVHSRAARDFFDALVAMGLLTRDDKGQYRNTEESDRYLDQAKPTFLGASFNQYNRREYGMWASLTQALQTGNPAAETQGQDHFGSLYADAARFQTFVAAMTSGSLLAAQGIASQFPWENYESLCDVGTAQGCLPVQVALAHPHIRAVGFDLPALRPAFESYAVESKVTDRLSFIAGDFFRDPLPAADVVVLGRVLHNWDLATKKMLLDKAYQAIQKGGAIIVYDMLIDDDRRTSIAGLLSSLNMLLWTSGGFGYTATDCIAWMRSTGFAKATVRDLPGGNSMIIGKK
ncbi:methyltransferase [Bradyrhizobium sp. WSM 1704]|nr:methyltransferase [Bradyrhizobium semiaridum]